MELYSASICPFAQRTRMVLVHKDILFDYTEIDLANKPDRFLKVEDGTILCESAIINE